jgi:hypothetical protein
MDKLEEDDIPGLLMLVDFEKAFDTIQNHLFLHQTPEDNFLELHSEVPTQG